MVNADKDAQEVEEGEPLCRGAGVVWTALGIKATDIDNADGEGIAPLAVRALPRDVAPDLDSAIETDNVVVAYAVPSLVSVPLVNIGAVEVLPLLGGGAMDYDVIDVSCHLRGIVWLSSLVFHRW